MKSHKRRALSPLTLIKRRITQIKDDARSKDDGISAIEFGFVAVLVFSLLAGFIVYGFYFATLIAIEQAVGEGARAAVGGLNDNERITLATDAVNRVLTGYGGLLDPALTTVSVQNIIGNPGLFEVIVTYDYENSPFNDFAALIPTPSGAMSVTATISHGGY